MRVARGERLFIDSSDMFGGYTAATEFCGPEPVPDERLVIDVIFQPARLGRRRAHRTVRAGKNTIHLAACIIFRNGQVKRQNLLA